MPERQAQLLQPKQQNIVERAIYDATRETLWGKYERGEGEDFARKAVRLQEGKMDLREQLRLLVPDTARQLIPDLVKDLLPFFKKPDADPPGGLMEKLQLLAPKAARKVAMAGRELRPHIAATARTTAQEIEAISRAGRTGARLLGFGEQPQIPSLIPNPQRGQR